MIELLAALSISAAAGIRLALPLLLIGLFRREGDLWSQVPLLAHVPPPIVLGVLVSWSLIELLFSKERVAQRLLQSVELVLSPGVGAIAAVAVARSFEMTNWLIPIVGVVGGLLALVLQLAQVGWFYRLRGLPLWVIFMQDFLCVALVLFAFDAPEQGGLIALLLLWLVIRSSISWQRWYQQQRQPGRKNPRVGKREPD